MELNFDKEIDAILRKAKSESATASGLNAPHLDADEISAFAANALPEIAKTRSTAHLADCERCRKILSNLILLDAETASEFVHAEETAPAIPWYRKLFIYPNLAYSLGALVLVFGGLIVFTILQSFKMGNADVSQVSNTFNKSSAPAAANANMASAPANMPANTPANVASNEPAFANAQPKAFATPPSNSNYSCQDCGEPTDEETRTRDQNLDRAKEKPAAIDGTEVKNPALEDKRAETLKKDADDGGGAKTEQAPSTSMLGGVPATKQAKKKDNKLSDSAKNETTTISGKTFKRSNSVWYDSSYNGQSTTNIARGSSEYKKLDGGLRNIAEKLSGVVIVVWKSKAYRIQ